MVCVCTHSHCRSAQVRGKKKNPIRINLQTRAVKQLRYKFRSNKFFQCRATHPKLCVQTAPVNPGLLLTGVVQTFFRFTHSCKFKVVKNWFRWKKKLACFPSSTCAEDNGLSLFLLARRGLEGVPKQKPMTVRFLSTRCSQGTSIKCQKHALLARVGST